jgi:hypothetical protein
MRCRKVAATLGAWEPSKRGRMSMPAPQTPPYQRGSALSRRFLPLALITIGVVFLLGNLIPERGRGGLIVLGLGAAFLVGRLTTGRRGYAVPAGILIALGTYISLQDVPGVRPFQNPAWFFVLLGMGFVLVYLIGLQPTAIWPLFPAAVMIGLGLLLFGASSLGMLASLSWIVAYWPLALVLLGVWLLFRDHLPSRAQRPIATLGGVLLLGYGILAAAASVAAGGMLARTGFVNGFGQAPFSDSVTLDAPIASGQTFTVDNPNGRTTLNGGSSPNIHVVATRHFSIAGHGPDVRLTPASGGISLSASTVGGDFPFGGSSWVEYTVDVPAGVAVNARSGSGQIEIDGVSGDVNATSGSGRLTLSNLGGSLRAQSGSGVVSVDNVAGDVRLSTSSGSLQATQVRHLREATSSSGSIALDGVFTDPARVHASSGSVTVKLEPGSAVLLDVKSNSGSISPAAGLALTGGSTSRTHLTGTLGTPANDALLAIDTSSGSVRLSQ